MSVESPHKDTKKHLKVCICRLYKFYKKKKREMGLMLCVSLVSQGVFTLVLNWIELKFISPLGVDLLDRYIQLSHSGADQTTVPRPSWRGGLGPVPNELWYGWMDDLSTWVLFTISGSLAKKGSVKANHTKQKKIKSTLYLVRTKASELADFPGVNTHSGL